MIPGAIGIGLLVEQAGLYRLRSFIIFSSVVLCAQLIAIVNPVVFPNKGAVDPGLPNASLPWRIMTRRDQWDWAPLEAITRKCGLPAPKIAYLGGGRSFYQPQIERPWVAAAASTALATPVYAEVKWLWRYEEGAIDWQTVMANADASDVVLTAPTFVGEMNDTDNLYNEHNSEFVARLSGDPLFQKPISVAMGRFEPIELLVFVKKSLPCSSAEHAADQR